MGRRQGVGKANRGGPTATRGVGWGVGERDTRARAPPERARTARAARGGALLGAKTQVAHVIVKRTRACNSTHLGHTYMTGYQVCTQGPQGTCTDSMYATDATPTETQQYLQCLKKTSRGWTSGTTPQVHIFHNTALLGRQRLARHSPPRITKDICKRLLRCGASGLSERGAHAHTGLPSMARPS